MPTILHLVTTMGSKLTTEVCTYTSIESLMGDLIPFPLRITGYLHRRPIFFYQQTQRLFFYGARNFTIAGETFTPFARHLIRKAITINTMTFITSELTTYRTGRHSYLKSYRFFGSYLILDPKILHIFAHGLIVYTS